MPMLNTQYSTSFTHTQKKKTGVNVYRPGKPTTYKGQNDQRGMAKANHTYTLKYGKYFDWMQVDC